MTLAVDPARLTAAGGAIIGESGPLKELQTALTAAFSAAAGAAGDPDAETAATNAGVHFSTLASGTGVAVLALGQKARLAAQVLAGVDIEAANGQSITGAPLMSPTDPGGDRFPKPPADPDGLAAAAGQMRTAAAGFHTASGRISATSNAALAAPWQGPSTVTFVSASGNLQSLAATSATSVGQAATATTAFARVVHDVFAGIDRINHRYDTALSSARTAAANQPPNPTADPYAALNALEPHLQTLYDGLIREFKTGAHRFVGSLADTSGTDPGTIIKASLHPEKAALKAVAHCFGPDALGLYFLASGATGVKALEAKSASYLSWLTNGMKARFTGWLGRSTFLQRLHDFQGASERYSLTSATSWNEFLRGTDELSKPMTTLLTALRVPEGALAGLSKVKGLLGKAFAPISMISGGVDLFTGGGDHGAHGTVTRVMGGVGLVSGGVGTAAMLGLVSLGPVGAGLVGAGLLAYGAYSLGNFVYNNRTAIWHGITSTGRFIGHTASSVYDSVSSTVSSTVGSVTHDIGHAITHPFGL